MQPRVVVIALLVASCNSAGRDVVRAPHGDNQMPASRVYEISTAGLRVTHGEVEAGARSLRIEHPVVRAVLRARTTQDVELRFTYRGPTSTRVALGSGETRVQIGAKLRAADGCNLVYAMLRLEPEPSVVVQV